MRAPCHAYLIHQRPYQEKRALLTLFCRENGRVSAVGRRGLPSFCVIIGALNGTNLKNLQKAEFGGQFFLHGHHLLAAGYINELVYRLLLDESPVPRLWAAYHSALCDLSLGGDIARICRAFERALFDALGVGLYDGEVFDGVRYFAPNIGMTDKHAHAFDLPLTHDDLCQMQADMPHVARKQRDLHRLIIDDLLGQKSLHSRALWASLGA